MTKMPSSVARRLEFEASMPRPFIKWAGGKGQLLAEIDEHVPSKFGRYFEPFLGGGAVFFRLRASGRIGDRSFTFLNDANPVLYRAYTAVRDNVEGLIRRVAKHADAHSAEYYLSTRDEMNRWLVGGGAGIIDYAAWLIYFNKTCFNGLWRVNKSGEFNVPMDPASLKPSRTICDADRLRLASKALKGVNLTSSDFALVVKDARRGDFAYFDPPYAPVNDTSDFTSYTKTGFSWNDQERLMTCARDLRRRGVKVLLSNADLPVVRKLYAGFNMRRVEARRAINSKVSSRGKVGELLIW